VLLKGDDPQPPGMDVVAVCLAPPPLTPTRGRGACCMPPLRMRRGRRWDLDEVAAAMELGGEDLAPTELARRGR